MDLFDHLPDLPPIARNDDPDTSAIAAAEITAEGERRRMMGIALEGLRRHPGLTSKELETRLGYDDGAIRKRLNDLRAAGSACKGGKRPCGVTGRMAYVWFAGGQDQADQGEWSHWQI